MDKKRIFGFFNKYWFMLFCCILAVFYLINVCVKLDSKEQYQYSKNKIENQVKELYLGYSEKFLMTPVADGMQSYQIYLKDNNDEGQIAYAILDEQENTLVFGEFQLTKDAESIDIDVSECKLKKNESYYIAIQLVSVNRISISVDNNNELYANMIFRFTDRAGFCKVVLFISVVFVIITVIILRIKSICNRFAFLSMTLGIIFLFIIPPCTVPDEWRHFVRAYDVTEGNVICKTFAAKEEFYNQTLATARIPAELFEIKMVSESNAEYFDAEVNSKIVYERWKDIMSKKTENTEVEVPIHGVNTISPLAYFPQIIFIFLGKIFGSYVGAIYYLSKFGNLLIATLLGTLALYITPKFKKALFALWFIPTLVYLRSSCSTDGLLFAFMMLLFAIFIKMYEEKEIDKRYYVAVFIVVIMIAQIKPPYALAAFVFLLCKKKKNNKLKWIVAIGSFIAGYMSYRVFGTISALDTGVVSNAPGTKDYIFSWLQHPFYNANMIFEAFIDSSWSYIKSAFECNGFEILAVCSLICILLAMRYCTDTITGISKYRAALIGGSVFVWLGIIGIFALISFRQEYTYVWGIQGRYMLPIFPFFFMGIANNNGENAKSVKLYCNVQVAMIVIIFVYACKLFTNHWI